MDHGDVVATYLVDEHDAGTSRSEHPGWEINLGPAQRKSSVVVGVSGRQFGFSAGEILIYNGREPYDEYYRGKDSKCEAFVIGERALRSVFGDASLVADVAFAPRIEDTKLIRNARETYLALRRGDLDLECTSGLISAFVLDLLEKTKHGGARFLDAQSIAHSRALTKDLVETIHSNLLDKEMNLDYIAAELGVTKFHAIRVMKKEMGCTPHGYIRHLRLVHAIERLRTTRQTVTEIALAVGFDNVNSLNHALRRVYDATPTTIRGGSHGPWPARRRREVGSPTCG